MLSETYHTYDLKYNIYLLMSQLLMGGNVKVQNKFLKEIMISKKNSFLPTIYNDITINTEKLCNIERIRNEKIRKMYVYREV